MQIKSANICNVNIIIICIAHYAARRNVLKDVVREMWDMLCKWAMVKTEKSQVIHHVHGSKWE